MTLLYAQFVCTMSNDICTCLRNNALKADKLIYLTSYQFSNSDSKQLEEFVCKNR